MIDSTQFIKKIVAISKFKHVKISITYSLTKISTRFYGLIDNEFKGFWIEPKEYSIYRDAIYEEYKKELSNEDKRFNKVNFEIFSNGTFTEKYWWDDEKERQKKLEFANIYHGWLNERLMSAIFDYEQENDLLSYSTDEEGEKEYLPSWDNGIFSFLIKDNKLESEIILIKDNQERHVALPLQDRLIKSILNHHEVTNNELSDEWQPWNKMVIDSPYEGIFLDMDDHIIYSMVEDEV